MDTAKIDNENTPIVYATPHWRMMRTSDGPEDQHGDWIKHWCTVLHEKTLIDIDLYQGDDDNSCHALCISFCANAGSSEYNETQRKNFLILDGSIKTEKFEKSIDYGYKSFYRVFSVDVESGYTKSIYYFLNRKVAENFKHLISDKLNVLTAEHNDEDLPYFNRVNKVKT